MKNSIDALGVVGSRSKIARTVGGARLARSNAEFLEQEALVQWADLIVINGRRVGEYLVHVPNEGKRGPKAASEFNRAGGRAGYPDLILDIPVGEWNGLRIEKKMVGLRAYRLDG